MAGFFDILALQGVTPGSAPQSTPADGGMRDILALQGVFPVEVPSTTPTPAGGFVSFVPAFGVWVDSAGVVVEPAFATVRAELNVDEYGQTVMVDFMEDITGATELKVVFIPRSSFSRTVKTGITVGTETVYYNGRRLRPNRYVELTIPEGLLDVSGVWQLIGVATVGSKLVTSPNQQLTVLP